MNKIKILITGATGFVGKLFSEEIRIKYPDYDIVKIGFSQSSNNVKIVDLTSLEETKKLFIKERPNHVFHFAAMVNPKLNEENKNDSYKKNFIITSNIIASCPKETTLYFLSTDKIYDSNKTNAKEEEVVDIPDNFYALMKLICENIIKNNIEKHYILRCPIIHSVGNNTSNSFIDTALIKLKNNEEILVFDNIIRHYILVEELIEFLISLIHLNKYGVYNVGSKPFSYFNRILLFANNSSLNTNLIKPVSGKVTPEIQTYNLDKLHSNFNKYFI